jgi:hypothetical protein
MKQLILDDELLDNEEKVNVAQKIKDFALSVQEKVKAAELLVRLAERSVRNSLLFSLSSVTDPFATVGRRRYCCLEADSQPK